MNYPSKSKVNVAVSNNHKFDLSKTVVTTHDFGRAKAIECRYMVPGDKFNIKLSSFTRLLPMVSPTFGKIDTVQRAFFVPIRALLPQFYDWVSNQPVASAQNLESWETGDVIPSTYMKSFVLALLQPNFSQVVTVADGHIPADGEYDFVVDVSGQHGNYNELKDYSPTVEPSGGYASLLTGEVTYFKLIDAGRKMYDFLVSLGLNINFDPRYKNVKVSLLPLLAFWKAYIDWVVPSRFVKEYPVNIKSILKYFGRGVDSNGGNFVDFTVDKSSFNRFERSFMHVPLSFYDNDYFTSAWLQPFQQEVLSNAGIIPNPAESVKEVSFVPSGIEGASVVPDPSFNYFTIQSLGKLQDYLNRGMLAGSKVQDWLETEFGLRPSTDALNLSTYLGKISDTIMIDDIYSAADTSHNGGQLLGAYAGRAKKGTFGQFKYSAREHGYFIITTEIIPKTSYYQGLTPEFSMLDRFDFFQPEFDNLGVQAISHKELFCSPQKYITENHGDVTLLDPEQIFGFAPRYANLKTSFDVVSGDFRNRFGAYLKSWYLARDVEKLLSDSVENDDGVISLDFASVDKDVQNWENMFSYVDDDIDHFYQIFVIENSASRPMISLEDALNPEHPNGSKTTTLKTHGGVE